MMLSLDMISPNILAYHAKQFLKLFALLSEIDEFKRAWRALGTRAPVQIPR